MLIAELSLWRESKAARSATYAVQISYCATVQVCKHCLTYSVHYALGSVLCENAVSSVQRAVFSVQCVVFNTQCAVYTDQSVFWSVQLHCFELLNTAC